MHVALEAEMDRSSHDSYNFFVIHDTVNYKQALKAMMFEKEAYFYYLTASDIAISVILYDGKYIITILT